MEGLHLSGENINSLEHHGYSEFLNVDPGLMRVDVVHQSPHVVNEHMRGVVMELHFTPIQVKVE